MGKSRQSNSGVPEFKTTLKNRMNMSSAEFFLLPLAWFNLSYFQLLSCMTDTTHLQEYVYQDMQSKVKEDDAQAHQQNDPSSIFQEGQTILCALSMDGTWRGRS